VTGIFFVLLAGGFVFAWVNGDAGAATEALLNGAASAVEQVILLTGVVCLWNGFGRIAEEAGVFDLMAKTLRPVFHRLFPSIPKGHPSAGYILMNITANMLGFGSAATPFGLKAMQELNTLNRDSDTASDAMITFLALNTSGVTLIPTTVIALRFAAGSANPNEILGTTLIATLCSTAAALLADRAARFLSHRKEQRRP